MRACLPAKPCPTVLGLCESRGGRPGLPILINPYGLSGRKATLNVLVSELRNCLNVEVAVLGSPTLIVRTASEDARQHLKRKTSDAEPWP